MTTKNAKAARKSARAKKARKDLPIWVVVTAIVVVIGAVFAFDQWRLAQLPGVYYPSQGNVHIPTVTTPHPPYNSSPPTSGWHVPQLAPWGETATVYPDELLLHNMEDGGVLVLFNPVKAASEERVEVRRFLQALPRGMDHIVFGPYTRMAETWALVAWTRLAKMEEFDFGLARRFIDAYRFKDNHAR